MNTKKRNLIILIIVIILLIIGLLGWKVKKPKREKPLPSLPLSPKIFKPSKEDEKRFFRFMGENPDEIPEYYKEKVEDFRNYLKNECLVKKENVKQFLLAVKNDPDMIKLLQEMKEITVSSDYLPLKVSPTGEEQNFEIVKYAVFECLNLNKEEFKECQRRLNGIEINKRNAEERVLEKMENFRTFMANYLLCKAVEQKDKNLCNLCSYFYLSSNFRSHCQNVVGGLNFMTSVYFQPDCKELCRPEKVDIDDEFTIDDCLAICQAIKDSDANECLKLEDKNDQLYCKAFITFDSNNCQEISPKIIEYREPDGTIRKRDQVADCLFMTLLYKSVKERNPNILKETKNEPQWSADYLNPLRDLYFGHKGCEGGFDNLFDNLYKNYCNLKYTL